MNLSEPFINKPIATTLLAVAMLVAGIFTYFKLPVAPLPNMAIPAIFVTASVPGASPETMSTSVAMPLQRALGTISGIDQISSSSSSGRTTVFAIFKMSKDINDAAREVQAAINKAKPQLPSNMRTPPIYKKLNPSSIPIMVLTLSSETMELSSLYEIASNILAPRLSQVEGVGEVDVGGGSMPAVRVEVNPKKLSSYGISISEVQNAIANSNKLSPRGSIVNNNHQWLISASDTLNKANEYKKIIVKWNANNAIRLKDIAEVFDSVEDEFNHGFFNKKEAVTLIVRKQEEANVIKTVDSIRNQIKEVKASLPDGVDLNISQDRSPSIRATLHETELTLLISVMLVIIIVLIFLRGWRATIIPAVAVPISLLGTFVCMFFMGFSLNIISLMGLIVASGFVVDDSIVVTENISRYIDMGYSPKDAANKGAKEVGTTVLTMSISLILVFLPLLILDEMLARLFFEFSFSLSSAVLISLLVSLTLTPTLCAHVLKKKNIATQNENIFLKFYKSTLKLALKFRFVILLLLMGVLVLNVVLFSSLPKTLFPEQDTGMLRGSFKVDKGTSFQTMIPKLHAYRDIILSDPNVENVSGYVGGRGGASTSYITVQLKPFKDRELSAKQVVEKLRNKLTGVSGARVSLVPQQDIRVGGGQQEEALYEYSLRGSDLRLLEKWGNLVRNSFKKIPEIVNVSNGREDRALQVELKIDREKAKNMGVDMRLLINTINNLYGSRSVSTIYKDLNQYKVILSASKKYAEEISDLEELNFLTPNGELVPLSAFAELEVSNTSTRIKQNNGMLSQSITFDLAKGVTLDQATSAIEHTIKSLRVPVNQIEAKFAGSADKFKEVTKQQPLVLLLTIFMLYIVLGILYESFIHPLTILSTLPSAGIGAFLALKLVDMQFSVIALIGVFLLIGIVMKNAIIMIDFALDRQRREKLSSKEAIYEACIVRFRPILMTTFAAIFGALPLILATGAGVEMRQPLGVTIVGGLIMSQLLTLYTTPVMYVYLDKIFNRKKNAYKAKTV
ncbi:efflux RND transporter permease subunit [Taylorella equigenitalis]|uniref:Multidrug resistance protein MdtC n=1 Tax=Taylorella equigenitalis ATCC 35865 TaxID=743973 RepID=A0ABM5NAD8_9BURK|nr:efflux RND transporter permease subunit [Taylorella equigenitalis]AFN35912.1 multidrug resistance protein MdtC [Taylorella equigenitalis ATCC 35865]ASY39321.1 multidrug transporter subunit MdtC [Taylorella equigenitalis]ASY40839.1 multidrug transporter subunit MdtC [Taylorella equigenitalis]VEG30956.1 Multidrug transporter MdtC [Taylorella equigenitalis ATCC 35865]